MAEGYQSVKLRHGIFVLVLLCLPTLASARFIFGSGAGGGPSSASPTAVAFSTTQPFVFDNASNASVVSPIAVTMTSGSFSGSLAFATVAMTDIATDGTTSTLISSASHNFATVATASDLVMVAQSSPNWEISSASHTFVDADVGQQVQILGGANWNANTGQCPAENYLSDAIPCAWTIVCVHTTVGCPSAYTLPAAGHAGLMHTGSSGVAPSTGGLPSSGQYRIVYSTERGQVLQITGGAGCATGNYTITGVIGVKAVVDRPFAAPGVTGCQGTITYDSAGQYAISAGNLVTTTKLHPANASDYVKVTATQSAITVTSPYFLVDRIASGARDQVPVVATRANGSDQTGGGTTGYAMKINTASALPSSTLGGGTPGSTPEWVNAGGDCWDTTPTRQACGTGTAYATFSSAVTGSAQTWTFNASTAIAASLAVGANEAINLALTSANIRTVTSCNDATAEQRPQIVYTYNDGSTDPFLCTAGVQMLVGNTIATGATIASPLAMGGSSGMIAFNFPRPDSSKTFSSASLTFHNVAQFGGTTTINLYRIAPPYVTGAPDNTGIAHNYIQDGCSGTSPSISCTLASDPSILYYAEGGETLSTKFYTGGSAPDCTATNAFDWTGANAALLPLFNYGKFVPCTTTDSITGNTTTPSVVTGSFNQHGYAALAANAPDAWMFTAHPSQEVVGDMNLWFKTTDNGDQTHAFVDGATIPGGAVVAAGVLPNELYLRYYFMYSPEFLIPDNATLQAGGKWHVGFAQLSECGNGGSPCNGTGANGTLGGNGLNINDSGRNGWSARRQWKQTFDPQNGLGWYQDFTTGVYAYNAAESQNDHEYGLASRIHRAQWYCLEVHLKMNSYVSTSPTAAIGARPIGQGTGYVTGDHIQVNGGTGTGATYSVTASGGLVTALTQLTAGIYTVFPVAAASTTTTLTGVGTGLTVDLLPVDSSSADGIEEAWINGVKVYSVNNFRFRGTPPWLPPVGNRPIVAGDSGIASLYSNLFFGGVYGGAPFGQPGYYFLKSVAVAKSYIGPMRMN